MRISVKTSTEAFLDIAYYRGKVEFIEFELSDRQVRDLIPVLDGMKNTPYNRTNYGVKVWLKSLT